MKRLTIAVMLLCFTSFFPSPTLAQEAGVKRTVLQRHDLVTPEREVVQARIDIAPGYSRPRTLTLAKRSSMLLKAYLNTGWKERIRSR